MLINALQIIGVSLADAWLIIFFVWYIGSVIAWLGSASTFVLRVSPALWNLSGDARKTFIQNFMPRFLRFFGGASISAAIAGTILYAYLFSINSPHLPAGLRFIFISVGALLGVIASIISLGVVLPMGNKLGKLQYIDARKTKEAPSDRSTPAGENELTNVVD